jgi:hypothetical protein
MMLWANTRRDGFLNLLANAIHHYATVPAPNSPPFGSASYHAWYQN